MAKTARWLARPTPSEADQLSVQQTPTPLHAKKSDHLDVKRETPADRCSGSETQKAISKLSEQRADIE
ncbi:hypothetical protein CU560_02570 [Serratia ureilytica]|nr:hypothetical protein CU560_02570 [Serratia ureilytica]